MLRGAGYVSITSTMDAECGAISGDIGSYFGPLNSIGGGPSVTRALQDLGNRLTPILGIARPDFSAWLQLAALPRLCNAPPSGLNPLVQAPREFRFNRRPKSILKPAKSSGNRLHVALSIPETRTGRLATNRSISSSVRPTRMPSSVTTVSRGASSEAGSLYREAFNPPVQFLVG